MEEQKKEKWQTNTSLRLQFGLRIDYLVLLQIKSNQSLSVAPSFHLFIFFLTPSLIYFFFGLFSLSYTHDLLPFFFYSSISTKKPTAILNALTRKTLQVDSSRNRAAFSCRLFCLKLHRHQMHSGEEKKKKSPVSSQDFIKLLSFDQQILFNIFLLSLLTFAHMQGNSTH